MKTKNKTSCIYKITCLTSNKFYIGSTTNINKRLKEHIGFLRRNKHSNKRLQKDWNKYGELNFRYEIIETIYKIDNLLIREKWWIDNTDCCNRKIGFNISPNPSSPGTGNFINLIGQKFGRLMVDKYIGNDKRGNSLFRCLCVCGKEKAVLGTSLKTGNTKSCGCLQKEIRTNNNNNFKHGYKETRIYKAWTAMKDRCNNPNTKNYKNCGGKGIRVCGRWLEKDNGFKNFLDDMGECPPGLSLYRIDRIKNYFKENCKWATKQEQARNRRNTIILKFNNKNRLLTELAKEYRINPATLYYRINNGWSVEKALTTQVKYKQKIKKIK